MSTQHTWLCGQFFISLVPQSAFIYVTFIAKTRLLPTHAPCYSSSSSLHTLLLISLQFTHLVTDPPPAHAPCYSSPSSTLLLISFEQTHIVTHSPPAHAPCYSSSSRTRTLLLISLQHTHLVIHLPPAHASFYSSLSSTRTLLLISLPHALLATRLLTIPCYSSLSRTRTLLLTPFRTRTLLMMSVPSTLTHVLGASGWCWGASALGSMSCRSSCLLHTTSGGGRPTARHSNAADVPSSAVTSSGSTRNSGAAAQRSRGK